MIWPGSPSGICAADNVGDNVGDIAGMGAGLFGSFAEATCAALVISSVSAVGILVCLITTLIATDLKPARGVNEIESTLKMQLVISTILATPVSLLGTLWVLFVRVVLLAVCVCFCLCLYLCQSFQVSMCAYDVCCMVFSKRRA